MEEKKTITIEVPEGKRAEWIDGVLTLVDEQPAENHISENITERIKTFEDACKWCAENGRSILNKQYMDGSKIRDSESSDILAYLKLRIITCALNEGWEPEFKANKNHWYVWFRLFMNAELEKMSEEKIRERGIYRIANREGDKADAYTGIVCSHINYVSFVTGYGSHLAFKSHKLAEYAGKQFIDIYADFCIGTQAKGGEE